MSSKQFVNSFANRFFLNLAFQRDQLFYFITFCRFCQVNKLWTHVQPLFFLTFPTARPKQSAFSFYHIFELLSSEFFMNKFARTSISRSVFPLLVLHSPSLRATALLLYHDTSSLSSINIILIPVGFYILCTNVLIHHICNSYYCR